MKDFSITGKELIELGFPQGSLIGLAIDHLRFKKIAESKEALMDQLKSLLVNPAAYTDHIQLGPIAVELISQRSKLLDAYILMKEKSDPYTIYGANQIEQGALDQMAIAMKLPVIVAGALMPDAHQGYGLPIGGVLATNNAVIPYGVGVDIGCRMALSIFDISEEYFEGHRSQFKHELLNWTKFGAGSIWQGKDRTNHHVLESNDFKSIPLLKSLHDKAALQLGTSGGGNHFVEWGIIRFTQNDEALNIKQGNYLALLSHSGSRGFGAMIANHYTQLAKQICKLPKEAVNLAYLDLDSELGQEYWLAMNLAGNYASACHDVIHRRLTKAIGADVLAKVENHHNFAWKEIHHRQEVIVHRKGATPAGKGVLGIIPGSMTAPGFLVRGKGDLDSLQSASHGAGRQMSRTKAMENISKTEMQQILNDHGVTLIGGGLDEAPMAYKDIEVVMAAQKNLVDIVARFTPKIVRMADDGSSED